MPPTPLQTKPKPASLNIGLIDFLERLSNHLGGDILPLNPQQNNIQRLVSQRAIDYELMRSLVHRISLHNAIFQPKQMIEAYATLDAIGKLRGHLIKRQGDILQIALLDKIGELTVALFKLSADNKTRQSSTPSKDKIKTKAAVLPLYA